jgi:beta-glucosidase
LPRPQKELKGFHKVFLKPGEQRTITITLNEDAFRYFNDAANKWVMDGGTYNVLVGSSSRDIRLNGNVKL